MEKVSKLNTASPKVAILLCTFNGRHHLEEQLDSFDAQLHDNWKVWASDDGSHDDTLSILEAYQKRWPDGQLSISFGPTKGFTANFLSLACNSSIESDFYAYSDQDDIWEPMKLTCAVEWLNTIQADIPALYCSRTLLVDASNNEIGLSPLFKKQPGFANALIQNIGGGNTMVFNNSARKLLQEAGCNLPVTSHDWWTYMLITGCGGEVFYDSCPTVRYRQHKSNLVGSNTTWLSRIKRIQKLWNGRFRQWNDVNIQGLRNMYMMLTPEAQKVLDSFDLGRESSLISRIILLKRSGIYRQTLLGNLGLVAAALFKKL
jgi:glycosyltransferase involved in cell wall biosynthesis